jgi:transcriptional regulator with XRE-family HTH domain
VISAIVSGRSYKDIHGAVKKPLGSIPEKDVLRMRSLYAKKDITQAEIAAKFGLSRNLTNAILAGRLYAHLPGALVKRNQARKFTDEQVLFIRLQYTSGISLKKLGDAYGGTDPATINNIVTGRYYADVPGATTLRPSGFRRRLTEEQVIQARRMYRTRYVFGKQIARELGIGDAVYKVIRGEAYKELPGGVPMHIKAIRRGTNTGPRRKKPNQTPSSGSSGFEAAMEVAD